MIDSLPKSSVIERMSLEARKHKLDAELTEAQVAWIRDGDATHINQSSEPKNDDGWITHRRPTEEDFDNQNIARVVYDYYGRLVNFEYVAVGEAWKPVADCEPYMKPKRFEVVDYTSAYKYAVNDTKQDVYIAFDIPTREAAEKIANIYERLKT